MLRRLLLSSLAVLFGLGAGLTMLSAAASAALNPVIVGLTPTSGTVLGGTTVTITGADFQPGAAVFIGGAPALAVTVESSTRLTVVTPRGSVGSANILVRNPDGSAVTLNGGYYFSAVTSDLALTGLSATSGPVRGGTSMNLTGTGFSGSTVLFGGAPALNVNVLGSSSISLRTPPGVPGPVSVTVRNADGVVVTLANAFTYAAGGPELQSVSPSGGLIGGGALVRLGGYAFTAGSKVLFGSAEARDVVVVNPTLITVTAPPLPAGTVTVQVVRPDGSSASLPNGFTARTTSTASGFTVTGVSPTSGQAVGGTRVDVTGTGISGGATIYFGAVPADVVSAPGPTTVIVNAPPNVAGPVTVTVVNADGSSASLPNGFRYDGLSVLAVTEVEPRQGGGGTTIAIRGSGFVTGAMVSVGGLPASNVWVVGDNLAYATVPAGTGAASVTMTNPGGLAATLSGAFTYTGGSGAPVTPPVTPTPSAPSSGTQSQLPVRGFGLFVFAGGSNAQLTASVACTASTLAFWATNAAGEFDTYIPGASIAAVNAGWNARFPNGIPASTPLIGRCQS